MWTSWSGQGPHRRSWNCKRLVLGADEERLPELVVGKLHESQTLVGVVEDDNLVVAVAT